MNQIIQLSKSKDEQSMFSKYRDIPNTHEKSRKCQCVCEKFVVMDPNFECLCCGEVKAAEYFKLLVVRYGDKTEVTRESNLPVKQLSKLAESKEGKVMNRDTFFIISKI